MNNTIYCIAKFQDFKTVNTPTGDEEKLVDIVTELQDYDAVLAYLKSIYNQHTTEMADRNAESSEPEDLTTVGGFCSTLTNQWGGVASFALGREFCLFTKVSPEPVERYAQGGECEDILEFWHVGWHHTEYWIRELAERHDCLVQLKKWLDTNTFGRNGG